MESWQADILAALEAGSEGLEAAQDEIAQAYRLAVNHITLTGAAESESTSLALAALQTALARVVAFDKTQRPATGRDAGDPVLGLLYLLTTLELLKRAREAIASSLENAWEQAAPAPFQPEEGNERG